MSRYDEMLAAIDVFERRVIDFDREYGSEEKLPRNHINRPYRFCIRDIYLGAVVVRHDRTNNLLVVDVCLTSQLPQFEEYSSARLVTIFLISEAFFCGGSLEIHFTQNVENGHVPSDIFELATWLGVELGHVEEGVITPSEARLLYIAITNFSDEVRQVVLQLSVDEKISPERVCFMQHHGIWTLPELESILLGSNWPERILLGSSVPEARSLYLNDLLHVRAALLGGFLDRRLAQREREQGEGVVEEMEFDERSFDISFNNDFYNKVYVANEQIPIPWSKAKDNYFIQGERLIVLIRPRTSTEIWLNLSHDIETAQRMVSFYSNQHKRDVYALLYPRDFEELSVEQQAICYQLTSEMGLIIMICPEDTAGLDKEGDRRLNRSRMLRR